MRTLAAHSTYRSKSGHPHGSILTSLKPRARLIHSYYKHIPVSAYRSPYTRRIYTIYR